MVYSIVLSIQALIIKHSFTHSMFFLVIVPLRTYQVRMLDSGEADTWRYDNGQWIENTTHPFALGNAKRPYEKGIFRRIYDSMTGSFGAGLYINSNKTADRNKDEHDKGYVIPWQNREVLYWCQKIREWQEKYNPIRQPTSATSLLTKHTGVLKSQQQLNDMGNFCYLFRDAVAAKDEDRIKPLIQRRIDCLWYQLLKELEDQLFAQGDTLSNGQPLRLVSDYPENYQNSKSATFFPLHGLRVSLITAYAMEGNVPLPVIAKLLAGHSRLITTVYYTKITPSLMAAKMQEAHDNLEKNEAKSLRAFLMDADEQQIQHQVACVSPEGIQVALQNRNPIGWVNQYHGLCLMGRNTVMTGNQLVGGCWNGGSLIKDAKNPINRVYEPVPHGAENCCRCRWFVSSAHHLPQLEAHLNFLSYQTAEAATLAHSLETELSMLNEERYTAEAAGKPFDRQDDLNALQRRFEKQTVEANLYTEDWIACFKLIARIREIELNRGEGDTTNKLVAVGSEDELKICVTETDSKLLQLALICDDAEYYPDLKDDLVKTPAIAERSMAIGRYMKKKGYQPVVLLMDEETQLIAINAMLRQMAMMMDKDNKLEGFRKAINYLEMEQYMTDEGLLKQGLKALSAYCKQPILKLVDGKLVDINEDNSHVH